MTSRSLLAYVLFGTVLSAAPAVGQQLVTVEGQVVERSTRAALAGVSLTLSGRVPALTGEDGRFRFTDVPAGRYALSIRGIGYAFEELTLVVWADTTLLIELDRAPVPLDTVTVRARTFTIRGEVVEASSGVGLIDTEVLATPDISIKTDPIGRFKLSKVPSGIPLTLRVQNFGYLPFVTTFVPQRDTVLEIRLSPDPVAQRMIAVQLERIDARSEGRRYKALPTLDHRDLLLERGGSLDHVLTRVLGSAMAERIRCTIVDENPILGGWRYETLLPDEVQRVEITEYTPAMSAGRMTVPRGLMVRVYTRAFVQDMVRGKAQLVRKDVAMTPMAGLCR